MLLMPALRLQDEHDEPPPPRTLLGDPEVDDVKLVTHPLQKLFPSQSAFVSLSSRYIKQVLRNSPYCHFISVDVVFLLVGLRQAAAPNVIFQFLGQGDALEKRTYGSRFLVFGE
ncbi:hypothetical protein H0H93_007580 [Arthromyces matolae]|nr:hypothetical protein H0H93_007580 [Arthromyces matolae]